MEYLVWRWIYVKKLYCGLTNQKEKNVLQWHVECFLKIASAVEHQDEATGTNCHEIGRAHV